MISALGWRCLAPAFGESVYCLGAGKMGPALCFELDRAFAAEILAQGAHSALAAGVRGQFHDG